MSTIIENIERSQMREGVPEFQAGDRVRVHFQVIEGSRRRTQVFEGVVIRRQGSGVRETFTVRKQSFGVGVERTFPLHSPKIEELEIAARGDVRRAKLYYLRGRVGKAARIAERGWAADDVTSMSEAQAETAQEPESLAAADEVSGESADQVGSEQTESVDDSGSEQVQGEGDEASADEQASAESSEPDQRAD